MAVETSIILSILEIWTVHNLDARLAYDLSKQQFILFSIWPIYSTSSASRFIGYKNEWTARFLIHGIYMAL